LFKQNEIVRRFTEAFASGDTVALEELVAEDVMDHNPRPVQKPGRHALIDAVEGFAAAFSDLETTIEQEVAEGDLVVHYGVMSGTTDGEMMGMPATNKRVAFAWIDIHRIPHGQIVESWQLEDTAGMLQQPGAAPD
jgi:steroid delta-isomerase-like uncharacterized protein